MTAGKTRVAAVLTAVLLVSACGGSDEAPRLMRFPAGSDGPDEFSILPTKPLEMPADMSALPEPVRGAPNLVDPRPLDDAVVALGGRPGAGTGDAALVAAAGRNGIDPTVRQTLAAEDEAFRKKQSPRLLERLFNRSSYQRAYSGQATQSYEELERWRAAQARTPSAPPQGAGR